MNTRGRNGFTLIELILVMALLAIFASIVAPALGNFFRGRSLDSEARRMLALTRHARERAISEGLPTTLWIDAQRHTYGLQTEPGYNAQDSKAIELTLDGNLQVEVTEAATVHAPLTGGSKGGLPAIRFQPDGSIAESSPPVIQLRDRDGSLVLGLARNKTSYEIRNQANVWNYSRW